MHNDLNLINNLYPKYNTNKKERLKESLIKKVIQFITDNKIFFLEDGINNSSKSISLSAVQQFIIHELVEFLASPYGINKQNAGYFEKTTEISRGKTFALAEIAKIFNNGQYAVNIDKTNKILADFFEKYSTNENKISKHLSILPYGKKYFKEISNLNQSKIASNGGGQTYELDSIRDIKPNKKPDQKEIHSMLQITETAASFLLYALKQANLWSEKNKIKSYSIVFSHNTCADNDMLTPIFYSPNNNQDLDNINNNNDHQKILNHFNGYLKYFLTYNGPTNEFSIRFYAQDNKNAIQVKANQNFQTWNAQQNVKKVIDEIIYRVASHSKLEQSNTKYN